MLTRSKYALGKIESPYGADSAPVGVNALKTLGVTVEPYTGNVITREYDKPTLGANPQINTSPFSTISYGIFVAGAGSAGAIPAYDAMLRACGLAATQSVGVDCQYDPVSSAFESVSHYSFLGAGSETQLQKLLGGRGDLKIAFSKESDPRFDFNFTTLFSPPAAAVSVTPDNSAFIEPVPVNSVNTPTITLGGFALFMESLEINFGNKIVPRDVPGKREVLLLDRDIKGRLTVEAPDIDTKDFFDLARSDNGITLQALVLEHGTTAGNIVRVDAPQVQLSNISIGDSDGLVTYSMDLTFIPTDAGDDEIKLTIK